MYKNFKALKFRTLDSGVSYFRPRQHLPDRVKETSPAVDVMTDLRQVTLIMVSPTTPVKMALDRMINSKVRMLMVVDPDGTVRGLITSRDIEGERPMRIMEKSGAKYDELVVRDIMTLKPKLDVLDMDDVLQAKVGDIISTLREINRQHAMVVDQDPDTGDLAVRGIFSLSQIGRQLGLNIDPSQRAFTFAELEEAFREID